MEQHGKHGSKLLIGVLVILGACTILGLPLLQSAIIKRFIVQGFVVPSASMAPTIKPGDRVLVSKTGGFKSGDIVVLTPPDDGSLTVIKRVVAVAGQQVDVRNGVVSVNGARLSEPYVDASSPDTFTMEGPVVVPAGDVWAMGDNRANSRDSRYYGPVPSASVVGKVVGIYWPPRRVRGL